MGFIRHHAIIVTLSYGDIEKVHEKAKSIFGDQVSNITKGVVNSYCHFFIAPDGSKEGWPESDYGDKQREEFIEWIDSNAYDDKSNFISYVVVSYGDENPKISKTNVK